MFKTVILGGGPAGCAAAYYLRQKGVSDITIVEKDILGGCSKTRIYEKIPFEYGPQILYTEDEGLKNVFLKFLTLYPAPNSEKKYKPVVSIDGKLGPDSIHDFPVTFSNVLKHKDALKIIEELYRLNLDSPDFSNFENYVISRMGPTLYETYVRNYNIKQWGIHPANMDAEWARFRPLMIQPAGKGMFKSDWQGHPGDYTPLWTGMTEGIKVVKGTAGLSENFERVTVDGDEINADMIVSTLPLSNKLDFRGTCLIYVSIRSDEYLMPSYATSFPNNYDFVRIMEYKQQFNVNSAFTLLDFQFSTFGTHDIDAFIDQAKHYVHHVLKREIVDCWYECKDKIYPVSTKKGLELVDEQIKAASLSKVIPIGRAGVHAYVSKDTCLRMARILADNITEVLSGSPEKKEKVLREMRVKLS